MTINVDEHSFCAAICVDQSVISEDAPRELTHSYNNDVHPSLLNVSPLITPAATPQPSDDDKEHKIPTLHPMAEPISPLSISNKKAMSKFSSTIQSTQSSTIATEKSRRDDSTQKALEKQRGLFSSRSSFRAKSFQKRSSASLISLVNRVPQNVFNDRIDKMMLLMKTNDEPAKEILAAYIDDADDAQAMIGALDGCLKDVY